MARGRRPDPPAVQDLKGNPGKRSRRQAETPAAPAGGLATPPKQLSAAAKTIWQKIGTELHRMNFLKASDQGAFARYCETLARYWDVTRRMGKGGEVYTTTSAHGTMERIHPLFVVQERLARRLEALEDRFGLNPQARQQYLLRMAQENMGLFGRAPSEPEDKPHDAPPDEGGPVGLLSRTVGTA